MWTPDLKCAETAEVTEVLRELGKALNVWTLQALVDGPSTDAKLAAPRSIVQLSRTLLTPIVIEKLPRGARTGAVKKAWEAAGIDAKWSETNWAKKQQQQERRQSLTDFDRFKVMRLKKQRRFEERKALAKVRAAA